MLRRGLIDDRRLVADIRPQADAVVSHQKQSRFLPADEVQIVDALQPRAARTVVQDHVHGAVAVDVRGSQQGRIVEIMGPIRREHVCHRVRLGERHAVGIEVDPHGPVRLHEDEVRHTVAVGVDQTEARPSGCAGRKGRAGCRARRQKQAR